LAFSPDCQTLLTDTQEMFGEGQDQRNGKQTLRFWELRSGRERLKILGEKNGWEFDYESVAFSPDGRSFATARQDRTIQLWDVVTGKELVRRSGYDARVSCMAFSPDGKTLATGHHDSTILVWDLAEANRPVAGESAATLKELERWWS